MYSYLAKNCDITPTRVIFKNTVDKREVEGVLVEQDRLYWKVSVEIEEGEGDYRVYDGNEVISRGVKNYFKKYGEA